jgi:hypothetical protein
MRNAKFAGGGVDRGGCKRVGIWREMAGLPHQGRHMRVDGADVGRRLVDEGVLRR